MSGIVTPAIQVALDALAERQRVTARNIANIQTPGYTAQRVNFESALSDALTSTPDASATDLSGVMTTAPTTDPAREDGNNVSLDSETLLSLDTNLRYSLALRALEGNFTPIRDVLRSS
jgi:flagellar basal-body rod protein FlgB